MFYAWMADLRNIIEEDKEHSLVGLLNITLELGVSLPFCEWKEQCYRPFVRYEGFIDF
jgi:hypothetical protein